MKRRVLTIIVAVLLAVAGIGGVLAYVHQADARAVAGMKAVSTLVAQQQIPAGTSAATALQGGLLSRQTLPASSVPADAVRSLTGDLGTLVASANIQPGQLLLRPMLVTAAQATGAGAIAIPKGMIAVTVPLCLPEAVAGYVQPGSQVAVFDTYSTRSLNVQENCGNTSLSHQARVSGIVHTRIVLPKVLVLSVGAAPGSGQGDSPASSTTSTAGQPSSSSSVQGGVLVTFAVGQADAERLILLTETGLPYLALLTHSSQTSLDSTLVPLLQP